MTRPALSELHSIRRSMQKRLAFYMITLAILLAATLVAGLFFFDQLKSPREGMVTSLNFRMEASPRIWSPCGGTSPSWASICRRT